MNHPTAAATATPGPGPGTGPGPGAHADDTTVISWADFRAWERQLASSGGCTRPILLRSRTDAIDLATGETASLYTTAGEPGGVLAVRCGNRREAVCPPCSVLPCRPRRNAKARRCPHGRDISCPVRHRENDPRLGQPICPDCYDDTAAVLFNAYAGDLWRRFITYLPRQLARCLGVTQKHLKTLVRIRYVKVAEYQARGVVHFHAVIRLDAPATTTSHRRPAPQARDEPAGHRQSLG